MIKRFLTRFIYEEDGAELIEYALVVAIVAVLCGAVLVLVGTANTKVNEANDLINGIDPNSVINGGGSGGGGTPASPAPGANP